tara:strand:+ start:1577 stop:3694 length:2118 start_codon:yes stop_codon:yes gene_type:complete
MIDTSKLIPQRRGEARLSGKTITTIGLIKKDVVKIDSLLKEKLVLSKVRYSILRRQNETDKRSRREDILERKKSRPQDYDVKSNDKRKGFGGFLGGILKALLAGIGFTIFKSLPALLRIGKVIKTLVTPLLLGASVFLGAIGGIARTAIQILPDVKGKNFKDASASSINDGIDNFKDALLKAAIAFAGGAVGGVVVSRLLRGKTFTEKEAAQKFAKGFKEKKGKVTGDEVFMTKDGKFTRTRPVETDELLKEQRKPRKIIKKISDIETFDDARIYQEQLSEVGGTSTVTKKPKKIKKSFVEELGLDPRLEKFGTEVSGAAKTRPMPRNRGIYGSPEVDQFFNQITNNKTFNNNPKLRTKVDTDFQLFLNARNPSVKRRRLTQLLNSLRSGKVSTLDINRLSTILTFSAFKPIDPSALTKPRPTKKRRGRPKKFQTIEEIQADIDARNPTFVSPETGGRLPVKTRKINASKLAGKKGLSKLLFNVGGEAFEQTVKQTIKASVGVVPIIGDLLGFILDVFLFGQPVGRAAFMALGSFIGSLIGGVFGLIGGPPGVFVGSILGGIGGDLLGGAFYDLIFRDNTAATISENLSQSALKKSVKGGVKAGFMRGGYAPFGGIVHAGEFVIDADSTRAIERKSPGFLMALNKAKGSQVDEVLETYMSYGNEGEGSERIVPLPFEKVVTRTVIANSESEDDSSSPFMDLYRRG